MTDSEPSSCLMATRLAAKSMLTDLQMEDNRSPSSQQARFIEQERAEKKQEIINLSIEHQILSPFTAFIAVEIRTDEEKASTESINLREIPIETRVFDTQSSQQSSPNSSARPSLSGNFLCDLDDEVDEDEEIEQEEDFLCDDSSDQNAVKLECHSTNFCLDERKKMQHRFRLSDSSRTDQSQSPSRRSRSRSRSPHHHDLSDPIRAIISLQNFVGLWEIDDLGQLISHLQENSSWQKIDLEKICQDYSNKDQNVILSMLIMFIIMKYFPDDEILWTPIIKKSIQAIQNHLPTNEYNELSDEIKALV